MAKFVVHRAVLAIVLLFVSSVIIFYGMRAAPGSVTTQIVNPANSYSVYLLPHLKQLLGLDKPLLVQYFSFMGNLLSGHPGVSLISGAPITSILGATAGLKTLELAALAIAFTYVIGIPLGLLAAWRRNTVVDHGASFVATLGLGIPNFFLAVLVIQIFVIQLRWFPFGTSGINAAILPAAVLAFAGMAVTIRIVRSSVLEQLGREYVRTHRAKGISSFRIIAVHSFRNSLPTVLAVVAVTLRDLIVYTFIVETVFRWPGIGYTFVESILSRDYTLAQTLALIVTALVIFLNFLADVGQHYADPRTRDIAFAT